MKILIIEDNSFTAHFIITGFADLGETCSHASTGDEGLKLLAKDNFDAVILDRMLPDQDGIQLLKQIKHSHPQLPVIFVTGLGSINDRVYGLNNGADDYLVKPFALSELHARLRSLLRRQLPKEEGSSLKAGDTVLHLLNRQVYRQDKLIDLNPIEFKLLEYLIKNAGTVVTKKMLLENIWNFQFDPKTSIVETHISRLRSKINYGFESELIQTVRGSGYKIDA